VFLTLLKNPRGGGFFGAQMEKWGFPPPPLPL